MFISHDGDLVVGSVSGAEYFTRIATEQSKRSTHAGKDKTDEEIPKVIPTHILNLSAPEIILGAQTSPRSTIFSIGALICWIASGKPFVKVCAMSRVCWS